MQRKDTVFSRSTLKLTHTHTHPMLQRQRRACCVYIARDEIYRESGETSEHAREGERKRLPGGLVRARFPCGL